MAYIGNPPTSSLGVGGPNSTQLNIPPRTISPPAYNVVASDQGVQLNCDASSGNITINLPSLASLPNGWTIFIKKIDATGNSVTIDGNASETINGQSTINVTTQWDGIGIQKTDSGWISVISSGASAGASGGGGGGGGGESAPGGSFDVGINSTDSLTLTTTNITDGYQYTGAGAAIIYGILAANIDDSNDIEVDALLNDSSAASDFYLIRNMPLPSRASQELIRRPVILDTNDRLKFRTDTANQADLLIRYTEVDSGTDLFNIAYEGTPSAVGSPETIYTESASNGSVIDSLRLANADGVSDVEVTVLIIDGDANPVLANRLNVPAKSSIDLAEVPIVLLNGDSIQVEITSDPTFLHVTGAGRNI